MHPSIRTPFGKEDFGGVSLLPLPRTLQVRQEGESLQGTEPGSPEAGLCPHHRAPFNRKWLTEKWPVNTTAAFHGGTQTRNCILESTEGDFCLLFPQLQLIRKPVLPWHLLILWDAKTEMPMAVTEARGPFNICDQVGEDRCHSAMQGTTLGFAVSPRITARAWARVPRGGLSPKCPNTAKSPSSLNHRSLFWAK